MKFTCIKETCLYVEDLERSWAFYHKTLGLPVISFVENSHVFFRAGNSVLLCFLPEKTKMKTSLPPHYGYGQLHLAFEAEDEDYHSWRQYIQEQGIEILQDQEWKKGERRSFYFRDPDGHLLEIVQTDIWE